MIELVRVYVCVLAWFSYLCCCLFVLAFYFHLLTRLVLSCRKKRICLLPTFDYGDDSDGNRRGFLFFFLWRRRRYSVFERYRESKWGESGLLDTTSRVSDLLSREQNVCVLVCVFFVFLNACFCFCMMKEQRKLLRSLMGLW